MEGDLPAQLIYKIMHSRSLTAISLLCVYSGKSCWYSFLEQLSDWAQPRYLLKAFSIVTNTGKIALSKYQWVRFETRIQFLTTHLAGRIRFSVGNCFTTQRKWEGGHGIHCQAIGKSCWIWICRYLAGCFKCLVSCLKVSSKSQCSLLHH